jgi:hypothetical protein
MPGSWGRLVTYILVVSPNGQIPLENDIPFIQPEGEMLEDYALRSGVDLE